MVQIGHNAFRLVQTTRCLRPKGLPTVTGLFMRILSWNINGIRTLPQYHPWYTLKTCEAMLEELNADIICFQEMKIQKSSLDRPVALPGPFDSVFSFPSSSNRGYSGVAVYTNSRKVVAQKAEEGLAGMLQPKPPLSPEEQVSPSYPSLVDFEFFPELDGSSAHDFAPLESEGRCLVLDFGLFVLINLYCPTETSEERLPFKMNFHLLLEERVRKLIEEEKREVIVVGDINVAAHPLDHGEGSLESRQKGFWDHPARAWFRDWLAPNGPMVDVIRMSWPQREGMFTCWNTVLNAREANYGARIDYILLTKGLLPWLKTGDIQADVRGSDHCPIYIELHDEIMGPSGETRLLSDEMGMKLDLNGNVMPKEPPRISAKFWEEFSGKQLLLSKFFVKKAANTSLPLPSQSQTTPNHTLPIISQTVPQEEYDQLGLNAPSVSQTQSASALPVVVPRAQSSNTLGKRKQSTGPSQQRSLSQPSTSKKSSKKKKIQQGTLATFFSGNAGNSNGPLKPQLGFVKGKPIPEASRSSSQQSGSLSDSQDPIEISDSEPDLLHPIDHPPVDSTAVNQLDEDHRLALALAEEDNEPPAPKPSQDKNAWASILAPLEAPLCTVHQEPAKRFTVNKSGPNKGKTFFVCSRPVGPGYDKGVKERLREEVDTRYRCNFFKWANDVRKTASREAAKPNTQMKRG